MNIEFRATGKAYDGGTKIFRMYIDNKLADKEIFLFDENCYSPDGLTKEALLKRFLYLRCVDFPENILIKSYIDNKLLKRLDYGESDIIGIERRKDTFIVRINVSFDEVAHKTYFNSLHLIKLAVKLAPSYGFSDCYLYEDVEEAAFSFNCKAEGRIIKKIEEGKKQLNRVMNKAAKELYAMIGRKIIL